MAAAASTSDPRAVLHRFDVVADLIIFGFHLLDESNGVQVVCTPREESGKNIATFIVNGGMSTLINQARSLATSTTTSKSINFDRWPELASLVV